MLRFFTDAVPAHKAITSHGHSINRKRQIHRDRIRVSLRTDAALSERLAVIRQASGERVAQHLLPRFRHQVGERGQRDELPVGEQLTKSIHSV